MVSNFESISFQILIFDDVQNSFCRGAGDCITAKCVEILENHVMISQSKKMTVHFTCEPDFQ